MFKNKICWIFDMDGTVYGENPIYDAAAWQMFDTYVAEKLDLSLPAARALSKKWQKAYLDGRWGMKQEVGLDLQEWNRYGGVHGDPSVLPVTPGLCQSLTQLPGHRMIFTDSDADIAEKLLRHLEIREAFHEVSSYTSRSPGRVSKTNPETYDRLAASLPVAPERCVFFENSIANLALGKQAGFTTVLVHGEKREPFIDAAYPNLMEALEDILSELDADDGDTKG